MAGGSGCGGALFTGGEEGGTVWGEFWDIWEGAAVWLNEGLLDVGGFWAVVLAEEAGEAVGTEGWTAAVNGSGVTPGDCKSDAATNLLPAIKLFTEKPVKPPKYTKIKKQTKKVVSEDKRFI